MPGSGDTAGSGPVRIVLAEDHQVIRRGLQLVLEGEPEIVVLTMEADPVLVRAARRAGALGYVLKESADGDLVEAVRRAAAGEAYLNRRLAARLVADPSRRESPD